MPGLGPGTEDSVTPDSELLHCWALLPAVSSLAVIPTWGCKIDLPTDNCWPGLEGIHIKLSPRFRSLAAALPIIVRVHGVTSDNSVLSVQAVIQTWSTKFAAVRALASVILSLSCVCKQGLLTVTQSSRGTCSTMLVHHHHHHHHTFLHLQLQCAGVELNLICNLQL
jgi:hypothetical protein